MTSSLSKYASSLILLEWGAIMLYFNLSGRVSAFLHPNFRPLLWLVGVSLALTAVIIAFAHKSACCGADEALSQRIATPSRRLREKRLDSSQLASVLGN